MDLKEDGFLNKDPFKLCETDRYIACVGDNGGTDGETILTGFSDTVYLIIDKIKNGGTEDELIYPLVFCARHSVELAIKISIESVRQIMMKKKQKCDLLDKDLHTHDIESLSKLLKSLFSVDRRIDALFNEPLVYAKDYYFDKKGDVFRYEKDTEGKESLKALNIQQISISVLEAKFRYMMELFQNGIYTLSSYIIEYSHGTFTKSLSRYDIELICAELPL